MMTEKTICSRCGKPAASAEQIGLCNDCLLAVGLGSVVDATAAGRDARFVPPEVSEIAPYFPQLDISELLGCGGMGAVYKARQKNLDRLVALKILPPDIGSAPAFAERFAREAKALAKLNHPNIVTLYEFGQAGELFYFLMEYVDGVNLGQLLRSGRVSPREALAIVPQICDALQYAHDAGIVHRDIKPENILLDRRGRVKVADFGLAKLVGSVSSDGTNGTKGTDGRGEVVTTTEAGHVMGTPQYMAPEQVAHPSDVDHRADIYSLGVVFYQMLTGELPKGDFAAPSKKVVVDVRLDEVVLRALEKQPGLRYQQVSEVKTLVETIATTPPQRSDAGNLSAPPSKLHRKLRVFSIGLLVVGAANALMFLSGGLGLLRAFASKGLPMQASLGFLPLALFFIMSILVILGAVQILRLRSYALAVTGSILAIMTISPLLPLGIGFGLGCLLLLFKPGVRQAFKSSGTAPSGSAAPPVPSVGKTGAADFQALEKFGSPRVPNTPLAVAAFCLTMVSGVFAAANWMMWFATQNFSESMSWGILISALAAVALAVPVRRSTFGQWAFWFGTVQTIAWVFFWLLFSCNIPMLNPSPASKLTFGPVVERVVTNMIDFDTGALIDFPMATQPDERDDARYDWIGGQDGKVPNKKSYPWMRAHGVDAIEGNHDLINLNLMLVARLEDRDWNSLTPAGEKKLLALMPPGAATDQLNGHGTYGFKTREGSLGIVQIIDQYLPRGVKLRYKLVKSRKPTPPLVRSKFPLGEVLLRNQHSLRLVHDDISTHYVLFYEGRFENVEDRSTHNRSPVLWLEDGTIKLPNGRTFVYSRVLVDSGTDTDTMLTINGSTFDLREGRVLVLNDEGGTWQLKIFPQLSVAREPDALAPLIAQARDMYTKPVTPEKLRAQWRAAEDRLNDLSERYNARHPLVMEAQHTIEELRKRIAASNAEVTNAAAKPAFVNAVGTVGKTEDATSQQTAGKKARLTIVSFSIPASYTQTVVKNLDAKRTMSVDVWDADLKTLLADGILVAVENQIDEATGTLPCKATVSPTNGALLYPNQFVNVRLFPEAQPGAATKAVTNEATVAKPALVSQATVESARTNLALITSRYNAGRDDRLAVVEAEQNLHWAEAMFAGDRKAAAIVRRDGAKAKLALLAAKNKAGVIGQQEMAAVEKELAEAEAALATLEAAPTPFAATIAPATQLIQPSTPTP